MESKPPVSDDFYKILGVSKDSSSEDIKRAYKRLVLIYHPDKNNNKSCEMFHQIHMAYQVLGNPEKRSKYDALSLRDRVNILDSMKKIISDLFDPKSISKIIVDEQIKGFLLRGEFQYLKDYVYQKIQSHYTNNQSIDDYSDIFIPSRVSNNDSQTKYHIMENDTTYESSIQSSTNTTDRNLMMTLHTTLEEIYLDKIKEITVLRHKYVDQYNTVLEEHKLYVSLRDDKVVFKNEGDQYMAHDGVRRSDIIIKIKCKKHHFIQRVNDYDLLLFLPITLYELFTGFNKSFVYFDNKTINIESKAPMREYHFDGDKLVIVKPGYGMPCDGGRGALIIYLLLNKNKKFYDNLKLIST